MNLLLWPAFPCMEQKWRGLWSLDLFNREVMLQLLPLLVYLVGFDAGDCEVPNSEAEADTLAEDRQYELGQWGNTEEGSRGQGRGGCEQQEDQA
ncbi:acidic leucine-rich nuclear phosphoprotein 32 family member B-like [Tamandua tetradactyla]|uniref:acidic leucine-rich nuclear phosphoprotein 32 family member B-like n=1 Tax=Tamandua tetradactyla TaxID=48850 RepID=UPI0040545697